MIVDPLEECSHTTLDSYFETLLASCCSLPSCKPLSLFHRWSFGNPEEKIRGARYIRDQLMWRGHSKEFISRCSRFCHRSTQPGIWDAPSHNKDVSPAIKRSATVLGVGIAHGHNHAQQGHENQGPSKSQ
uniref:Uncharacterized protein n=1 Tax=Schistocephalus solidus TaxID=70667 RepID=A0A0X3QHS9_SCHSO